MKAYDAVAGIDERALDLFVSEFYGCARAHVFHRLVSLAGRGVEPLTGLELEVDVAPRIGFVPAPGPSGDSSTASFELWVDHFTLTLHSSGAVLPMTLSGTMHATAELTTDAAARSLAPRLTGVTVDLEGEKKLSTIFNTVISPHLDQFVQEELLDPIRVPVVEAGDLAVNGPVITTGENRLLITAAIDPAVPAAAPLEAAWPEGVVFVAADFALVNELAEHAVPEIPPQGGEWKKTVRFGLGQSTIKASYSGTVTGLTLAPVVGQPTQLEGTATIDTAVAARAKHLFDVRGTGLVKATVTAEAVVTDSGSLGVRLTGLKPFSVQFSFPGGAAGFAAYAQTMANAASVVLREAISAALRGLPLLEVGRLPSFELPVDGQAYRITIQQPAVRTITVGGQTLLMALAVPAVTAST